MAPNLSSSPGASAKPIVRVGLIGCGEIAQVVHIPTLGFLGHLFRITYLCDVSAASLEHCRNRVFSTAGGGGGGPPPQTTTDPSLLCASPDVDVVFVLSSDAYHAEHAVLALRAGKRVMVEKPAAVSLRDLRRIRDAEAEAAAAAASGGGDGDGDGSRVMVGYMRRYSAAFAEAVRLVGGLSRIRYARVRDIVGPNAAFVAQSGTFPQRFSDDVPEGDAADLAARTAEAVGQGLRECGCGGVGTESESDTESSSSQRNNAMMMLWRLLGGLGSHDVSAMREALGRMVPVAVRGAAYRNLFWSAIFEFPDFDVVYESGIDDVPRFDAHIEVYGGDKTVKVQFDTPYVKGLPVTIHVAENTGEGQYRESTTRVTYEDPYTQELKELHAWVTEGRPIKTTLADAEKDLEIFGMIMRAVKKA